VSAVIAPALVHGAWLCAWMTLVVLGSLRHDPRIWQHDAPRALQELLGPPPPETAGRKRLWVVVMMVGLVGVSTLLMREVGALPGGDGFGPRMLAAYVMFETFNLYDAIVLDIGVILLWAPDWAFVPGTKRHPSLLDWRFHVRAFFVGVALGVPFAAIVAGIAMLWP